MKNNEFMLQPFTLDDIPEAAQMTQATWGEEIHTRKQVKEVLYEAMVRYYYRNGAYSYKIVDAGQMQAFLLAGLPDNNDRSADWLEKAVRGLQPRERVLIKGYHNYLAYNGQRMAQYAKNDDVLMHLFLSRKPGCGHSLLKNIVGTGNSNKKKSLLLWTDETCDYDYYQKNGFRQLDRFTNTQSAELGNLRTLIYRKII